MLVHGGGPYGEHPPVDKNKFQARKASVSRNKRVELTPTCAEMHTVGIYCKIQSVGEIKFCDEMRKIFCARAGYFPHLTKCDVRWDSGKT